jgi:pyrimidine oxygenase
LASIPGTSGVLLTFDDFVAGVEKFGRHIQPKMKRIAHLRSA